MTKKLFSFVVILCLSCATGLQAQEKSESALSAWIKNLQQRINQIVPKKNLPMATGVAGTRGAKEDVAVKLYWKGKKGDESVAEEELLKFKIGVDLAGMGDPGGSAKALEQFMKEYPDSALIPDAKKTLDLVKIEVKAEKKAEPHHEKKEVKKDVKKETKKEEAK
jgi:TolA-binding protein